MASVDPDEHCTSREALSVDTCVCRPWCIACGYGRHAAAHLPALGQPKDAPPILHEYQPAWKEAAP